MSVWRRGAPKAQATEEWEGNAVHLGCVPRVAKHLVVELRQACTHRMHLDLFLFGEQMEERCHLHD